MLNRIRNCLRFAGCFTRYLGGLPLDTVHGSDKWFIGSDNLSLLPMAKIVHVNLRVVCAFNDCDVLHFTMFLSKIFKLEEFWSFVTNLTCTLTLRLSPFPHFLHFLFLFSFSSVLLFLCWNVPISLCSCVPVFICFSVLLFFASCVPR